MFVDKVTIDGAALSFLLTTCTKHGLIKIVGVIVAEMIETVIKHLQPLQSSVVFVDLELAQYIPKAFVCAN